MAYDWDYSHGDYDWDRERAYHNRSYYSSDFTRGYSPYPNDWDYPQGRNYGYKSPGYDRGFQKHGNRYDTSRNLYGYPKGTNLETGYAPGPYEGVGPRGYQRSDERIADDVHSRLTRRGQIDARGVQVTVKDRVVTLTGTVHDRRQKRLAEDLVDSVPGVVDVNNRLKISNR